MLVHGWGVYAALLISLAGQSDPAARPRLDAHGFPLPEGVIARLGDLTWVAPEWINRVAISPDGKLVASAARNVHIWNVETKRVQRTLKTPDYVALLAFSSNGKLLAGMGQQSDFIVWNVATGKPRWTDVARAPVSQKSEITGMRFVAEDQLLAITLAECRVELWDVEKGTLARTWDVDDAKRAKLKALGDGYAFIDVALSPSGELTAWLASPNRKAKGGTSSVLLHETASGRLVREVKGLPATDGVHLPDEGQTFVLDPAWYREEQAEKYTVVGVSDGRVRFQCDYRPRPVVISAPPRQTDRVIQGERAYQVGQSLFTKDGVGLIRWDRLTGKKLDDKIERFTDVAFSANGKRAVAGRGMRLFLCDEEFKPRQIATESWQGPEVRFLADGRLVTQSQWEGLRHVWNSQQGKIVESVRTVPAPPVGRAPGSYDAWGKLFVYHKDKGLVVRDLVGDRQVCRLAGIKVDDAWDARPYLSPDGQRVLVITAEGDSSLVRWFDSQSGRELGRYRVSKNEAFPEIFGRATFFSESGRTFGYLTPDSRLALVDCDRGKVSGVLDVAVPAPPGQTEEKRSTPAWHYESTAQDRLIVASTSNGIASGRLDFAVWSRATSQLLRRFAVDPDAERDRIHWNWRLSPDARLLAVCFQENSELHLYETASGSLRGRLRAPNAIESFDFAPDGKTLATSCADTTVLIWDLNRPLSGRPAPLLANTPAAREQVWQSLANPDAAVAEQALWTLLGAPREAVAILRERLAPPKAPAPERLAALIAQLDSRDFKERERASLELTQLQELALPALRGLLQKETTSLEQRRRAEQIVAKFDDAGMTPTRLRELRAIEVLERLGTAEARQLLETLATGATAAQQTLEAQVVLERLRGKD